MFIQILYSKVLENVYRLVVVDVVVEVVEVVDVVFDVVADVIVVGVVDDVTAVSKTSNKSKIQRTSK